MSQRATDIKNRPRDGAESSLRDKPEHARLDVEERRKAELEKIERQLHYLIGQIRKYKAA